MQQPDNAMATIDPESGLCLSGPASSLLAEAGHIALLHGDIGSGKSLWLARLAGLQPMPKGVLLTYSGHLSDSSPVVRMLFDRRPQIWLGQTVAEELCFGLPGTPNISLLHQVLTSWGLDGLDLQADVQSLNRLQGLRLGLASMDIAKATLALLDSPTDSLPEAVATQLIEDIQAWAARSNCIIVVACNRWQGWQHAASHIWQTTAPSQMPVLDSRGA